MQEEIEIINDTVFENDMDLSGKVTEVWSY